MAKLVALNKKKITQSDLRRIMTEQKLKLQQTVKKIESPLAKYTANGQLTCIVCDSVVRSEAVWSVHINSKQHRNNIAQIKRRKETEYHTVQAPPTLSTAIKRQAPQEISTEPKKVKGILKNSTPSNLPSDFFDSSSHVSEKKSDDNALQQLANESGSEEEEEEKGGGGGGGERDEEGEKGKDDSKSIVKEAQSYDDVLPEGFFDDPLLDAKARNVEYKDPIEEEWEKFQKALKEETAVSAQIIAEDQEEATAERQIDEIDEQMRNWSRVLDLEKKKEEVVQAVGSRGTGADEDEVSSADETEFEEYLDWRAKKSYK